MSDKKYLGIIIVLLLCSGLMAQEDWNSDRMQQRRERIEQLRIWKMTEFLDLTTEQSEKFFPRLRSFENQVHSIKKEQADLMQEIYIKLENSDYQPSEEAVLKIAEQLSELEHQIIKQKIEFIKNLSDTLSPEQQIKFLIFENRFRNRLMKAMCNPPNPPHNDHHWRN